MKNHKILPEIHKITRSKSKLQDLVENHKAWHHWSVVAVWRSNRSFTVGLRHIYDHGNNESSTLFWSLRKDKVGMINNSNPINVISYTHKVISVRSRGGGGGTCPPIKNSRPPSKERKFVLGRMSKRPPQ